MDTTILRQHHGHNIKRLRDIMGVKQEAIAAGLGIPQQRASELEQKDIIDDETLEKISKILNVPVERIKEFSDERLVQYISGNTFENNTSSNVGHNGCYENITNHFNPIEKITELFEYFLKDRDEKITNLEKEIAKIKKSS